MFLTLFLLSILLIGCGYFVAKEEKSWIFGTLYATGCLVLTLFFAANVMFEFAGRPQDDTRERPVYAVYQVLATATHGDNRYALLVEPDGQHVRLFLLESEDEISSTTMVKVAIITGKDGAKKNLFRPLIPTDTGGVAK